MQQVEGLVVQTMGKCHMVWDGERERPAFPAGRLALQEGKRKNRVAVGDRVILRLQEDGSALIETVLPRLNHLSRRITFTGAEHVVAANLDLVAVMLAPNPGLNTALLDRYLAAAFASGIDPLILVNKMDLLTPQRVHDELAPYYELGYPIHTLAAKLDLGLGTFHGAVAGKRVVLVGHSGVGKTTLVNHLVPGARGAVAEVHEASGKGRHTTSSATAHRLTDGTMLVDTAGIREFALFGLDERDLSASFPEIQEASARCKFPDCRHSHEPGCSVREAVERGRIAAARHESYLSLLAEVTAARQP